MLKIILTICNYIFILFFLILTKYNFPSADDFCNTNLSKKNGIIEMTKWWYFNWSGRYFSNFLASANPLILGNLILYNIVPIALVFVTIILIYYFFNLILVNNKIDKLLLTSITYILILFNKPTISEGYFWYTSSITYEFANLMLIFLAIVIIKYNELKDVKYFFIAIITIFIIVGSNETSMLLIDFFLIIYSINNFKLKSSKNILIICSLIFSLFVILAPGNEIRSSYFELKNDLKKSTIQSIVFIRDNLVNWILFPTLIITTVSLFIKFKVKIILNNFMYLFLLLAIMFIGIFPGFWAMGLIAPDRSINVIHFIFTIIYIIFLINLIELTRFKLDKNLIKLYFVFLSIISISVFFSKENNIKIILSDLISGRAKKYYTQLKNREFYIKNSGEKNIKFKKMKFLAKSIYVTDLDSNYLDWKNKCFCEYYHLEKVIVE
jgi:hypothetical protein